MKKEIAFNNFYSLLTKMVSEVHPDKTTREVAKEVEMLSYFPILLMMIL